MGDITLAFYSVMFSYDGWNGIGYTVEENKNSKGTCCCRCSVVGLSGFGPFSFAFPVHFSKQTSQ